jgi:hypothetical protein
MARKILSLFAGLLIAVLLVGLIEYLGHIAVPPPDDIDFSDPAQLEAHISNLPFIAFAIVLLAWCAGAFFGSLTAGLLSQQHSILYPAVISGFVLLAAIANMIMIPHPLWFAVTGVILVPLAGFMAWYVHGRFCRETYKQKKDTL